MKSREKKIMRMEKSEKKELGKSCGREMEEHLSLLSSQNEDSESVEKRGVVGGEIERQ